MPLVGLLIDPLEQEPFKGTRILAQLLTILRRFFGPSSRRPFEALIGFDVNRPKKYL